MRSIDRFERLVAALDGIVWEADARTFQFTFVSEKAERMLGYPLHAWLQPGFWADHLYLADRDAAMELCVEATRDGRDHDFEYRMLAADGRIVWLRDLVTVECEEGLPVRLCGIMIDITAQRQAEEERRLFRALADRARDGFEIIDLPTGRFLDVNEGACRNHGFTREEYLALKVEDLDPHVAAVSWAVSVTQARAEGWRVLQSVHRRKDGTTFPVEVSVTYAPLEREYLLAVVRDVTERQETELALRRAADLLRRVQEIAHVGGWTYDVATRQFELSEELVRITGSSPGERTLEELMDAVHPEDRLEVSTAWEAALTGQVYDLEHRILRSGREIWLHVRGEPELGPDGRVVRLVGVAQDISKRRLLEGQAHHALKLQAVGRLAGGVAHDFNNMLAVINGYCDLLRAEHAPDSKTGRALTEIRMAGERARLVTRQLLAFGRKQLLKPKLFRLGEWVLEIGSMLQPLIGEDIALDIRVAPDGSLVRADGSQLEQALLDLASNARDAMPSGGRLSLAVEDVTLEGPLPGAPDTVPAGRYVRLQVSDSGVGIPPDLLPQIFEPFFTTKPSGEGTGLGLPSVYGAVKQNHGFLTAESISDEGSRFTLYLPAIGAEPGMEEPRSEAPQESLDGGETLLVVEDEEMVRRLMACLLEGRGYHVLQAAGADEALSVAAAYAGPIHLMVTDVVMPGHSGPELARALLALRPTVRVLFVSGYHEDTVLRRGVSAGMATLLTKPFRNDDLLRKVRELLDAQPEVR